jgi:hypothetical protein
MTDRDNRQINDVVGIFDDAHVFSDHEKAIFSIVKVSHTRENLDLLYPQVREVNRSKTIDWTLEEPERKQVWRDARGDWKEVVEVPRFAVVYDPVLGTVKEAYSRIEDNTRTTLISAVTRI